MLRLTSTPSIVKTALIACTALGATALSPVAQASTTILNWGGKYVTSYVPFEGTQEVVETGTYRRYSDSTPILNVGLPIYGATSLSFSSGTTAPSYDETVNGLRPGSTKNTIALSAINTPAGGTLTLRGLFFVKKENFIDTDTSLPATFDADSKFQVNVTSSTGSTRQVRCAVYALVGGEWGWYVSLSTKAGGALHVFSDLLNEKWAPLSISDASPLLPLPPTASAGYTFTGQTFDDIGAIGLYFNQVQTDSTKGVGLYFDSLEASLHVAAPIPEASTLGMALIGTGLCFSWLRFGKK